MITMTHIIFLVLVPPLAIFSDFSLDALMYYLLLRYALWHSSVYVNVSTSAMVDTAS
jgi:hypothetical protein